MLQQGIWLALILLTAFNALIIMIISLYLCHKRRVTAITNRRSQPSEVSAELDGARKPGIPASVVEAIFRFNNCCATLEQDVTCSVCTNTVDDVSTALSLPCGHIFHARCCLQWLERDTTCPNCRAELRAGADHASEPSDEPVVAVGIEIADLSPSDHQSAIPEPEEA